MTPKVTVVCPTFNNLDLLHKFLNSFMEQTTVTPDKPEYHIVVVNNAEAGQIARAIAPHPLYSVADAGKNAGWEGGLNIGLKVEIDGGFSEYVLFANDDLQFVPGNPGWLNTMVKTLDDHPEIGMVGPISNFVMGAQHFHSSLPPVLHECRLLIGFCVLVRRKALEQIGGVVEGLPGGDDFDLSIRMFKGGYKLAIQGNVFVFHHGGQTGRRVYAGYWDSPQHQDATRNEIIRRHGLKSYLALLQTPAVPYK